MSPKCTFHSGKNLPPFILTRILDPTISQVLIFVSTLFLFLFALIKWQLSQIQKKSKINTSNGVSQKETLNIF